MGIKDKLDLPEAEAWKPEVGAQLIGKVLGIDERTGDYEPYPCVTVLTEGGDLFAVHAFHTVLKNELAKLEPREGDDIGISYRGVKKSASGQEYQVYKVVVERGDGTPAVTPDWAGHAASAQSELAADDSEPF